MKKDWLFTDDESICNFRSVGLLIRDNKILVQRDKNGAEYALPGGHVIIGETAIQSLIREYKEETGADIICKDLIFTEECFWGWKNKLTHTIAFYYIIELMDKNGIPDTGEFVSQKDNCDVVLGWMPIEELNNITIYPPFLKDEINNLPKHTKHFISKE